MYQYSIPRKININQIISNFDSYRINNVEFFHSPEFVPRFKFWQKQLSMEHFSIDEFFAMLRQMREKVQCREESVVQLYTKHSEFNMLPMIHYEEDIKSMNYHLQMISFEMSKIHIQCQYLTDSTDPSLKYDYDHYQAKFQKFKAKESDNDLSLILEYLPFSLLCKRDTIQVSDVDVSSLLYTLALMRCTKNALQLFQWRKAVHCAFFQEWTSFVELISVQDAMPANLVNLDPNKLAVGFLLSVYFVTWGFRIDKHGSSQEDEKANASDDYSVFLGNSEFIHYKYSRNLLQFFFYYAVMNNVRCNQHKKSHPDAKVIIDSIQSGFQEIFIHLCALIKLRLSCSCQEINYVTNTQVTYRMDTSIIPMLPFLAASSEKNIHFLVFMKQDLSKLINFLLSYTNVMPKLLDCKPISDKCLNYNLAQLVRFFRNLIANINRRIDESFKENPDERELWKLMTHSKNQEDINKFISSFDLYYKKNSVYYKKNSVKDPNEAKDSNQDFYENSENHNHSEATTLLCANIETWRNENCCLRSQCLCRLRSIKIRIQENAYFMRCEAGCNGWYHADCWQQYVNKVLKVSEYNMICWTPNCGARLVTWQNHENGRCIKNYVAKSKKEKKLEKNNKKDAKNNNNTVSPTWLRNE